MLAEGSASSIFALNNVLCTESSADPYFVNFCAYCFCNQQCLEQNKQVVYDLLSCHGDTGNMIFFAMIMQGCINIDLSS